MRLPRPLLATIVTLATAASLSSPCAAQTPDDNLKRCLADFGAIRWTLPYRPLIYIRACASRAATYDTSDKPPPGQRTLELIGELTLGADSTLSSDETYAAIQQAVFAHLHVVLTRHGFRRVAVEEDDARTRRHAATLRLLHPQGGSFSEVEKDAELPPIPYVKLARYEGQAAGAPVRVICKADLRNSWRIVLEGLPESVEATGGSR